MSNLKSKIHTCREKLAYVREVLQDRKDDRLAEMVGEVSNTLNSMYPEINRFKQHINRLTSKL